jgi:hypothetical protein
MVLADLGQKLYDAGQLGAIYGLLSLQLKLKLPEQDCLDRARLLAEAGGPGNLFLAVAQLKDPETEYEPIN